MRIAAIQCGVSEGDIDRNVAAAVSWLELAAAENCRLVVLPECSLTGYGYDSRAAVEQNAVAIDGPEIGQIIEACTAHNIIAIVGFFERRGGLLHNSAALVGPTGLIGVHRKNHLPCLGGDRFVERPPETSTSAFATEIGIIGIAICYEIRFPEIARTLALNGSEIIALPTNWPVQSTILADHFTRVRAAENMVFFVAANRNDASGGTSYLGHSQIIDPWGGTLAFVADENAMLVADLDLEAARSKKIIFDEGRFELNLFADRRPEAYRL